MLNKKELLSGDEDGDSEKILSNEFTILMRAHHPNIVKMYDIFQDEKCFYVVQEMMNGGDLYKAMTRGRHFKEAEAKAIVKMAASALNYLHSSRIVHRDLKSDNLLFVSKDKKNLDVKLADFGLASYIDP